VILYKPGMDLFKSITPLSLSSSIPTLLALKTPPLFVIEEGAGFDSSAQNLFAV
jgi:hypothetical protein